MGRPCIGTRRRRGNLWFGGVARLDDPTKRVEPSFTSEAAMEAWIAEQLVRRDRGLEPEPPKRRENAVAGERHSGGLPPGSFEAVARQWHDERYVEMEHAGADRQLSRAANMSIDRCACWPVVVSTPPPFLRCALRRPGVLCALLRRASSRLTSVALGSGSTVIGLLGVECPIRACSGLQSVPRGTSRHFRSAVLV